jgi:diadenosine tetraphosphate (Ap4A) HIT family hydrolase
MTNTQNCIFCKIASGELDSAKIWDDENFLAFLDINPNTKGMTLVIPKKHFDSYTFDMNNQNFTDFALAAKKVAKILEKSFNVKRVAMVMEGLGVNHAHYKLYPIHGLDEKFVETWAPERIYFDSYPGYFTTQLGPQKSLDELKILAKEIKENTNQI